MCSLPHTHASGRAPQRLRDEGTLSLGAEGEGQGTQMQKWAKADLPSPGHECKGGTESQVTHPPGPSWVQSHPALPLADPGDLGSRPGTLCCVQTGWRIPPGARRPMARCQEGSPTTARLTTSSKGPSLVSLM